MITQGRRVAIRAAHVPAGGRGLCAVCHQRQPCDAIQLIDELEEVVRAARAQFQEISGLRRLNDELAAKIHRAVLDIHRAIEGLT